MVFLSPSVQTGCSPSGLDHAGVGWGAVAAQLEDDPCLRHVPNILLTGLVDCGGVDSDVSFQAGSLRPLPKRVNMDLLSRCITSAIQVGPSFGECFLLLASEERRLPDFTKVDLEVA